MRVPRAFQNDLSYFVMLVLGLLLVLLGANLIVSKLRGTGAELKSVNAVIETVVPAPPLQDDPGTPRHSIEFSFEYQTKSYRVIHEGSLNFEGSDDVFALDGEPQHYSWDKIRPGKTLELWIDPTAPDKKHLFTHPSWLGSDVWFIGSFLLLFLGVGGCLVVVGTWGLLFHGDGQRVVVTDGDPPQLEITPTSRRMFNSTLAAIIILNVVVLPLVYWATYKNQSGESNFLTVLAWLLPPLSSLFIIYLSVQSSRQWHQFGPTKLMIAPYPVQIGKPLVGYMELKTSSPDPKNCQVTLECSQTIYSSRFSHHNSRLWIRKTKTTTQPTTEGWVRFNFMVTLPETLPPSAENIAWNFHLVGNFPEGDLVRNFRIPVAAAGG